MGGKILLLSERREPSVPRGIKVYLFHSQQRDGERQVPWRALAGWACMQWVLLATSLLCRAWKALGAVLLGMVADGAGLTELSAAEPSLQNKKKKMFLGDKLHVATQESFVSTLLQHTE